MLADVRAWNAYANARDVAGDAGERAAAADSVEVPHSDRAVGRSGKEGVRTVIDLQRHDFATMTYIALHNNHMNALTSRPQRRSEGDLVDHLENKKETTNHQVVAEQHNKSMNVATPTANELHTAQQV